VLLFPAVKTMLLCMAPLFVLLTSCHHYVSKHYNGHIVIAVRDIPAGTVLQPADFRLDHGWTLYDEGACLSLPSHVLGHKTLRPVVKDETIHASDIEGASARCIENVADGWSGWQ
jgi:hypothetical protein